MRKRSWLAAIAFLACGSHDGVAVPLPDGEAGIGFDDLRYSTSLHAVLAPAGRTGVLAVVHPDTMQVETIAGFSAASSYSGGHDFGATSVDEGDGFLFVTDRTSQKVYVVDPSAKTIVASTPVAASPDYVRYVDVTHELWITEPAASQIEIFSLARDGHSPPSSIAAIPVENGPESLVIDSASGRAYTHRWQASSLVFDVRSRALVAEWPNGCAASRGLALDSAHGFFIADCAEGTTSVLDAKTGAIVSSIARGAGFDVMGYSASLGHAYLAGGACGCLEVLGVSATGELSFLGRFDAPSGTHCAVADEDGHAWVCDPAGGQLWRVEDPFAASR